MIALSRANMAHAVYKDSAFVPWTTKENIAKVVIYQTWFVQFSIERQK